MPMKCISWREQDERKKITQQPLNVETSINRCVPYHLFKRNAFSTHSRNSALLSCYMNAVLPSLNGWKVFFIGRLVSLTQIVLSLFTYSRNSCNMHIYHTWTKDNIFEMICSLSGFFNAIGAFFSIAFRIFTVIRNV